MESVYDRDHIGTVGEFTHENARINCRQVHVFYGEKMIALKDGLPKFKDLPKEFGGSGDTLPE